MLHEERLGLTYARLAGIAASRGEILVFVDDDNVLAPDYLAETGAIFERHARLGASGGKSLPEWEVPPAAWVTEFSPCLALRDLGDTVRIGGREDGQSYPAFAPLGAGMGLRRAAAEAYVREVQRSDRPPLTDRRGRSLASGGDNDIVLTVLAAGWEVGYFPELRLVHLMPAGRLTRSYLARLHQGMARSWVQVLAQHGIRPWHRIPRWTLLPRKVKAFFHQRAWAGPAAFVRWRGACGTLEGRAELAE
jgi:glycosyltransferase involved in cell wall biosynthesis